MLSQMDIAGGIVARARVAMARSPPSRSRRWSFSARSCVRDLISVYAEVERRGRTSLAIRIEVVASRDRGRRDVKVTSGLFTFVALDETHRPRPLPPS